MSLSFSRFGKGVERSAGVMPSWTLSVARFVCVVVALHVPSWLMGSILQAPRSEEHPLLDLDLLAAAAIACVSTALGGGALVLAWAADFLRAAAKNYHFMSVLDFVDAARFVDMLNVRAFVSIQALGLVFGLVCCIWLVLRLTRKSAGLAWSLLGVAVLAAVCDIANGTFHVFGLDKDSRIVSTNVVGSPIWNLWHSERPGILAGGRPTPMRAPATFDVLRDWQMAHPGRTSMLVLVESMGEPVDPALRAWLFRRLATTRITARWEIGMGDEEFVGSTTSGELRTLCGLKGHYTRLDAGLAADCLPHQFARQGVAAVGIHGFGLRMFDRAEWWPMIGLRPLRWPSDDTSLPMSCNVAFPGVCDSAVIETAVTEAQLPGRFVYALTLDTHLPIDMQHAGPLPAALRDLCAASSTPEQVCQLVNKLGDLLGHLESVLASSEATPFLVVVGDHAPPFNEQGNREAFVAHRVPMFVMTPR